MPFDSRKLHPIYEALDCRNPKQALKLCDAVLKKSHVAIVAALKSVALQRLGKGDEAIALARQLASTSITPPIDDHLLSTLLVTFKDTGNIHEAVTVYESAHKAEPGNTEVALSLFSEYLRTSEFAKAQALSMKLYKGLDGAEYLYWVVTCMLFQVDQLSPPRQPNRHYAEGGAHPDGTKQLQLAAAMLGRAASQGKLTKPSHLQLYLEVLKRQSAHDDAIALLSGPHGELAGAENARLRLRAELLEKSGQHAEAMRLHTEVLVVHTPDDWEACRGLLRCAGAISRRDGGGGAAATDDAAWAEVEAAVGKVHEAHPRCRAPLLARLMLRFAAAFPAAADAAFGLSNHTTVSGSHQRVPPGAEENVTVDVCEGEAGVRAGAASGVEPDAAAASALVAALHDYFERYGEKPVAALDVRGLLAAFANAGSGGVLTKSAGASARAALLEPLDAKHGLGAMPSPPDDLGWLRRYIALSQWRLSCGAASSGLGLAERMPLAASMLSTYVAHQPLSAGLDSRERGHADTLPLLAAQILIGAPTADWVSGGGTGVLQWPLQALLRATLGLRQALAASPHNFQLALALISCYLCLGASASAVALYRRLKIRYIQHESLCYLLMPAADGLGATAQSNEAFADVRRFQSNGLHELPENLTLAFKSGNYPQALEFVALRRSLESSWLHTLTDVMQATHNLRRHSASAAALLGALVGAPFLKMTLTRASLAALPDPADLAVYEDHLPHEGVGRLSGLRYQWLPRRALLLRVIWHSLRTGAAGGGGGAAAEGVPPTDEQAAASALVQDAAALEALVGEAEGEPYSSVGAETADGEAPSYVVEDWEPLLAMVRLAALLSPPAGMAPPSCADVEAAVRAAGTAFLAAASQPLPTLDDASGVPTAALFRIAHLAQLVVPSMCVFVQRWATLLPGGKKKKKPAGAGAEEGASEAAAPADVRALLREQLDAANTSLANLSALLSAGGRRSSACIALEQAPDEWRGSLGGDEQADVARQDLLKELEGAGSASFEALATAVKNQAAALKHMAKNI